MPLPKFEDWTPPWKDDDFDAEKAKKLIYNLHVDKAGLQDKNTELTTQRDEAQTKVTEHETKDLSELEKAKRELEELKANPPKSADDLALARFEIALDKGLTRAQAKRLIGTSREELETDATAYMEEHGLNNDAGDDDRPPSRRPKGKLQTGLPAGDDDDEGGNDPAKLAAQLPPRRY